MDSSTITVPSNTTELDPAKSCKKAINGRAVDNQVPGLQTNAPRTGNELEYLGPWKLLPVSIAMGLAIFILGLACA